MTYDMKIEEEREFAEAKDREEGKIEIVQEMCVPISRWILLQK